MKTPMQEVIEQLREQAQLIAPDDCVQDKFYKKGLLNAIKYAEAMLEKEKEVMCEFAKLYDDDLSQGKIRSRENLFNETFNTKEK